MYKTYSFAFKEQALVKVYSRGERTIESVADELNMKVATLKIWMKRKLKKDRNEAPEVKIEKRPKDWRLEEQLLALQESYGLTGEALNAWCRGKGLFAHNLTEWKNDFCVGRKESQSTTESKSGLRQLKEENEKTSARLKAQN